VILSMNVEQMTGRFVRPGTELLQIGDPDQRQLLAMVQQEDVAAFRDRLDDRVDVHFWGEGNQLRTATLQELEPRATDRPPHPALTATNGGDLPVRMPTASEQDAAAGGVPEPRLLEPRVLARLRLQSSQGGAEDAAADRQPMTGQRAVVSFRADRGRVVDVVSRKCVRWYLNRQAALLKQWRL